MQTYAQYKPTTFDTAGLGCEDRQDWFVVPCGRSRDSSCLEESNFAVALTMLGGESETCEVHRFGHWACGWFEIILLAPERQAEGEAIENTLADYPVLDDLDFSEREQEAANEAWANCYNPSERIAYIRKHRSEFEFQSLAEVLGCVRGKFFNGYASELLAR